MSVGPTNAASSVVGSQLAQSKGADADRSVHERTGQTQQLKNDQKAASAAGIGETEQDSGASDRDADGRRIWEIGESPEGAEPDSPENENSIQSKDATGKRGNQLDLSG